MSGSNRNRVDTSALYVIIAAFLVILLLLFGTSIFLKVMRIEVTGASIYTEEEIITASGISSKNNLLFMRTGAASERISSAMPFISEVKITRSLPDTILITVKESSALAAVACQDGALIIDSSCRVLQYMDAAPPDLIEVRGFTPVDPVPGRVMKVELGGETRLRYLTDVLAAIEKSDVRADVTYLDVANITNITVGYTGRFRVILGGPNNALYKLNQLPQVIGKINKDNPYDGNRFIDMSDSTGEWRSAPDL